MSYVKESDIFDKTNGGLDIILSYYPNAEKSISSNKLFKLRESEKTASASLHKLDSGIWVVTDFGGDNVSRTGIQVFAFEENTNYGKACALLGARYQIQGAALIVNKPLITKRPLLDNEIPGSYDFTFKDFTEKELSVLGPRVNEGTCKEFKLCSIESFTYFKENEAIVTTSTEDYPIFAFDEGDWQKIYQPNSLKKEYRFRYSGKKPSRHVFGLYLVEKEYKKLKKEYY